MTQPPPPQYPPGPGQPYPPYPSRPPKKSNTGTWILLILLGLVLLLCGSCAVTMFDASDDQDSTVRTTTAIAASPLVTARATTARPVTTTPGGLTDDQVNALAFTMALDSKGIRYSSRENAVGLAQSICEGKAAGVGETAIAVTIAEKGGYSVTDAAYIVGAAQATYCP